MTTLVELPRGRPESISGPEQYARWCCAQLEAGNILFFPHVPFEIPEEDARFLLAQRQSDARHHKNIAYRPSQNRVTGCAGGDAGQVAQFRSVMRRYSRNAIRFASELLAPYAEDWRMDFASYRPYQEKGRQARLHARNDLLHFDSFPTRPSNGDRLLRIFTNLNPGEPRVWITSETFEALAPRFAGSGGMTMPRGLTGPRRTTAELARALGLSSLTRSPYDQWMLRFHHFLKANGDFQSTTPRARWEFPPLSTWLVFTDAVSHAVLSGQFALEQTLIVPVRSLVLAEKAPVRVLERLACCALTLN